MEKNKKVEITRTKKGKMVMSLPVTDDHFHCKDTLDGIHVWDNKGVYMDSRPFLFWLFRWVRRDVKYVRCIACGMYAKITIKR
jgi:hypothetical protein